MPTDTGNIHAELRHEDDGDGYYTLRYLVFNGDTIGSYGVKFNPQGNPYGASRDFHQLVDDAEIERIKAYRKWADEDDYEGDPPPIGWGTYLNECVYHDDRMAVCDGSSLVEIIVNNDQRCFEIAAMMANVERDHA
jgi:hypothetical protein